MSPSPTLKISNNLILNKDKPFPKEIAGYKALYVIRKTLKVYCNICASQNPEKVLAVKLAFFEDDQHSRCDYCKKAF
jgi:transposase-like protein